MNLESTLRNVAKHTALFGAAAYLTLSAIACNGSAAPTVPSISTPTPAATAPASPAPNKPEEQTPTPQQQYSTATPAPVVTPAPTPTATPPQTTPSPQPPTQTPATPAATAVPSFTDEQLRQKLSGLEEILRAEEPALDADGKDYKGYVQKVQDIFEAGYYLTSGKTPQQHGIEVKLLTDSGIDKFIEEKKLSPNLKGYLAFKYTFFDLKSDKYKHILIINGESPTRGVIEAAVHESGHALAFVLNPKITGINLKSAAVRESQAYAFEAAFNRTLDEFKGGGTMLKYGQNVANEKEVSEQIQFYEDEVKAPLSLNTIHSVGRVSLWVRAKEKEMLTFGQPLSAKDSYALFLDLVTSPKDDIGAEKFLDGRMNKINPDLSFIEQYAVSRLVPNLPPEKEGPSHLLRVALLTP